MTCNGTSRTAKKHCEPLTNYIAANPGLTNEQLAEGYGIQIDAIKSLVSRLIECKWVKRDRYDKVHAVKKRPDTVPDLKCHLPPAKGLTVCRFHGGNSPIIKKAGEDRLLSLMDPAIDALEGTLLYCEHAPSRLACARDILDRIGMKAVEQIKVTNTFDSEMLKNLSDEEIRELIRLSSKIKPSGGSRDEASERLGIDIPSDF